MTNLGVPDQLAALTAEVAAIRALVESNAQRITQLETYASVVIRERGEQIDQLTRDLERLSTDAAHLRRDRGRRT